MKKLESKRRIYTARLLAICMANLVVPWSGFSVNRQSANKSIEQEKKIEQAVSRPLTAKEMKTIRGKGAENPYIAGSNKWDISLYGVSLLSGNFSTTATDLSFEGGYGIPINVTRSYSANNGDEGPFGFGWTLSADIRTTAGGLLKSAGAPIRSVPESVREFQVGGEDAIRLEAPQTSGYTVPPITEGIVTKDSSGKETKVQRDVDGILTTPPWDKNEIDCTYEKAEIDENVYELTKTMTVRTPEGTVYQYDDKDGDEPDVWTNTVDDGEGLDTPTNILKIISVTDRHGNATTYTYGSTQVTFSKLSGTTVELPLESITMPDDHVITFVWGDVGEEENPNRVYQVTDGTRTVDYDYADDNHLTSVTTPGNMETTYAYGAAATVTEISGSGTSVLTEITDPRGLVTEISYAMSLTPVGPTDVGQPGVGAWIPGIMAYRVMLPNGNCFYYRNAGSDVDELTFPSGFPGEGLIPNAMFWEYTKACDAGGTVKIRDNYLWLDIADDSPYFWLIVGDNAEHPFFSHIERKFNYFSQDLLQENVYVYNRDNTSKAEERFFETAYYVQLTEVNTTYNFRGNPLSKTLTESSGNPELSQVREITTEFAYWGSDSYYQQKAVKDPAGRISFTDYFDNTAATGKKGQVEKVYDPKHTVYADESGGDWRNTIYVDSGNHAAEFDYDSNGRATDVWKLKNATGPVYVHTETTYGADGSGSWGNASSVIEDEGGGKINRETETLEYDFAGRAKIVEDAAGKVFETEYDDAGRVLSVTRTDTNPDIPIVSYTYGTTGIENGMPLSVTDEIYGIWQTFEYEDEGGGIGQIKRVDEGDENSALDPIYSTHYTYTDFGARQTARYLTPNGDTRWKYDHYTLVGDPISPSYAFQTMTKMNGSWNPTAEEFHYLYDSAGRLTNTAFAQSLRSGHTDYTDYAASRCVANYLYLPSGQLSKLTHYWDKFSDDPADHYETEMIQRSVYGYDDETGLRTAGVFQVLDGSFATEYTQDYEYDPELDYLTEVNYGDGYANDNPTWSYDDAGNRSGSYTYDNLNRMSASPGYTYSNDILGNRTWRNYGTAGVQRYKWDDVNRLTSVCGVSSGATYKYRADGMRVQKITGLSITWVEPEEASPYYDENQDQDYPTVRYYYDGQMGIEEDHTYVDNEQLKCDVTRYGIGARGIDMISINPNNAGEQVSFPIYDGHGNMIYTLKRESGDNFSLNDRKVYDVWGSLRNGSGGAEQEHCANLGHRVDDESDLIYMRARYYEPWTGRFISEDPGLDGNNWFVYCDNNPINQIDFTGRITMGELIAYAIVIWEALFGSFSGGDGPKPKPPIRGNPRVERALDAEIERRKRSGADRGFDPRDPNDLIVLEYLAWSVVTIAILKCAIKLGVEITVTAHSMGF